MHFPFTKYFHLHNFSIWHAIEEHFSVNIHYNYVKQKHIHEIILISVHISWRPKPNQVKPHRYTRHISAQYTRVVLVTAVMEFLSLPSHAFRGNGSIQLALDFGMLLGFTLL